MRTLIAIDRPPVCTGITADGWITWRPGDVIIRVYRDAGGRLEYEAERVGA